MWSRLKNEKSGFTLIELIIVIVILGIIAGVAIPKFIGLSGQAGLSAARGCGGAMNSTITSLHANYLITGTTTYDIDDVLSETNFAGGVQPVVNGSDIDLVIKGKTYKWSYTDQVTEVAGFLTEDASSEFP